MKYKTFRNLMVGGAIGLVVTCSWAINRAIVRQQDMAPTSGFEVAGSKPIGDPQPVRPDVLPAVPTPSQAPTAIQPVQAVQAAQAIEAPSSEYLKRILGSPAQRDKLTDVLGASQPKVNVYAGEGKWIRAKVDLDRDGKWDEKWDVVERGIKQRISTRDDDSTYDREFIFENLAETMPKN
jgi:hypothetical protein